MPAKGWLSVRDLPTTKNKTVKEVMKEFHETYTKCDACNGQGHTVKSYDEFFNGISTVRFDENDDLVSLNDAGKLNGDTVKKIVETIVHGRQQCDKCKGFGFVKKSGKKTNGTKE